MYILSEQSHYPGDKGGMAFRRKDQKLLRQYITDKTIW